MRRVAIAGVGSTVFGRFPDTLVEDLAAEAAWKALEDAQVERSAVQAIYLGNFISGVLCGQEVLAGVVANRLGLGPVPCTKMEGACASGGIAFRHAYLSEVEAFRNNYRRECFQAGIDYVELDTSMQFDKALAGYLAGRKARY